VIAHSGSAAAGADDANLPLRSGDECALPGRRERLTVDDHQFLAPLRVHKMYEANGHDIRRHPVAARLQQRIEVLLVGAAVYPRRY